MKVCLACQELTIDEKLQSVGTSTHCCQNHFLCQECLQNLVQLTFGQDTMLKCPACREPASAHLQDQHELVLERERNKFLVAQTEQLREQTIRLLDEGNQVWLQLLQHPIDSNHVFSMYKRWKQYVEDFIINEIPWLTRNPSMAEISCMLACQQLM